MEEARFVMERLDGYRVTLPVIFDWEKVEGVENARTNELSRETRTVRMPVVTVFSSTMSFPSFTTLTFTLYRCGVSGVHNCALSTFILT